MEMTVSRKYLNKTMYRNEQVTKLGFRNTHSDNTIQNFASTKVYSYELRDYSGKYIKQKTIYDNRTPNAAPMFLSHTKYHCLYIIYIIICYNIK